MNQFEIKLFFSHANTRYHLNAAVCGMHIAARIENAAVTKEKMHYLALEKIILVQLLENMFLTAVMLK